MPPCVSGPVAPRRCRPPSGSGSCTRRRSCPGFGKVTSSVWVAGPASSGVFTRSTPSPETSRSCFTPSSSSRTVKVTSVPAVHPEAVGVPLEVAGHEGDLATLDRGCSRPARTTARPTRTPRGPARRARHARRRARAFGMRLRRYRSLPTVPQVQPYTCARGRVPNPRVPPRLRGVLRGGVRAAGGRRRRHPGPHRGTAAGLAPGGLRDDQADGARGAGRRRPPDRAHRPGPCARRAGGPPPPPGRAAAHRRARALVGRRPQGGRQVGARDLRRRSSRPSTGCSVRPRPARTATRSPGPTTRRPTP